MANGGGYYYIIRRGDTLSRIAQRNGLKSWKDIYYHGKNSAFRAKRPNPNLIYPNDRIWIPNASRKRVITVTGKRLKVVKKAAKDITGIKLISVAFVSGHGVLLDNNSTWDDSGNRYPEPEWTPSRSCPITHTKGKLIEVTVKVEVTPGNAKTAVGGIRGKGPDDSLSFEGKIRLEAGQGEVTISAKKQLEDVVKRYSGDRIGWEIVVSGKTFDLGSSGPHTIYATYAKPSGTYITEKRVAQVVQAAEGKSGEQECVNAVFDYMMRFHYYLGAPYPNPVWLVYDGVTRAECNALADLFKQSCLMLGLPDKFVLGHIYPLTRKAGGKFDVSGTANEKRNVAATHPAAVAASHGSSEKIGFRDFSTRASPFEGWNNFEGAVKYGSEYYCIGEGRFSSPTETMQRMVVATAWFSDQVGFCKNPGPCPEAIWNASRWASIPRPC